MNRTEEISVIHALFNLIFHQELHENIFSIISLPDHVEPEMLAPIPPDLIHNAPDPDAGGVIERSQVSHGRVHLVQHRHPKHLLEPLGGGVRSNPQDQHQSVVEEVRACVPEPVVGGARDGGHPFVPERRRVQTVGRNGSD